MISLSSWSERPPEEANLFNPPIICALIYEFVKEYSKVKEQSENERKGPSVFIVVVALAISLHAQSRNRLPYSTITSLYSWVQNNEDLLVGLPQRSINISPFVREAIMFGVKVEAFRFDEMANLVIGKKKATFTKSFFEQTSRETRDIVEQTRFVGRWLSKSGSEISVAGALGVKP